MYHLYHFYFAGPTKKSRSENEVFDQTVDHFSPIRQSRSAMLGQQGKVRKSTIHYLFLMRESVL